MSLPPGFLDELRNRLSLAQVVGRKVTWDLRKSNQGKGDFWAPCPFHQEKSASFHVDDRKGFYHCFGCHAGGDMLKFVQETENVSFMEAVETLAREAGLPMPARDPQAQQKTDRRSKLYEVMELAVQWFRLQLKTGAATTARDYLARRKLSEAAGQRFELGWAPDSRFALTEALKAKGVPTDLIVATGLAALPEDGGAPYDRFRGRIIFPIRNGQGRVIGFGGRSLDPNARAKYLNSPQTEIFDKGRELYNQKLAREAVGKGATLVVAEGYMDVIALSEAGFTGAVAPLGTAVTEDQLRLMWRIADEPIIALDGDTAGFRAALRVIDLALPMLTAGKGLRFAILPSGQDPDDLIKASGPQAMQAVLDGARPMVDLLWQRETEGKTFDSPERRAALDRDLRTAVKRITDPSIRHHYGEELNYRRQELFRPARAGQGGPGPSGLGAGGFAGGGFGGSGKAGSGRRGAGSGWRPKVAPVLPETQASLLAAASEGIETRLRESLLLAVFLARPDLISEYESQLARLEFSDSQLEQLRLSLCAFAHLQDFEAVPETAGDAEGFADDAPGFAESASGPAVWPKPGSALQKHLWQDPGPEVLERLQSQSHIRIAPAMRPGAPDDLVRTCLAEEFAKLASQSAVQREFDDALEDIEALPDEGLTWRLSQAAEARNRAFRAESEDKAVYETAENGVALNREEKAEFDGFLNGLNFRKPRRSD